MKNITNEEKIRLVMAKDWWETWNLSMAHKMGRAIADEAL